MALILVLLLLLVLRSLSKSRTRNNDENEDDFTAKSSDSLHLVGFVIEIQDDAGDVTVENERWGWSA